MTNNVAQALGCTPGDSACLCSKANFAYGIRDCSAQACPPGTDQVQISSYIGTYCAAGESRATTFQLCLQTADKITQLMPVARHLSALVPPLPLALVAPLLPYQSTLSTRWAARL